MNSHYIYPHTRFTIDGESVSFEREPESMTHISHFIEKEMTRLKELNDMRLNWYYKILGGHTHVKVFMNGAQCGELTFTNAEFEYIKSRCLAHLSPVSSFINERI